MPLLDLFWTMLLFFLFIAWISLLIQVYADVFRSQDLSGVGKAAWTVFVLVLPYLGVFVYLIARGGSMHERSAQRAAQAQRAAEEYIRSVAAAPSSTDELIKLTQLRDQGALTSQEFETRKAKLLV
jgi:small-conductance mechanosensitive channel